MLIECDIHGKFFKKISYHIDKGSGCPECSNHTVVSEAETRIYDYVKKQFPDAEQGNRTILEGKEIDIFIPSKSIAIEYCGIYWHSDKHRPDNRYHYNKWKKCAEQNIHLITIFEDENKYKVLNALDNFMFSKKRGTFARKQEIREVSSDDSKAFLDKYHLQGNCGKKITYGLYANNVLTCCMSFASTTGQSKYEWELKRFCTDGKNHAGAVSRLFSHFLHKNKPKSVVALSDRRWFKGNVYPVLGFRWNGEVKPDYYYVKHNERWHKSRFRKSEIKSKLPEHYDEKLTTKQMMQNAGYNRIWNCGKDRWIWTNELL